MSNHSFVWEVVDLDHLRELSGNRITPPDATPIVELAQQIFEEDLNGGKLIERSLKLAIKEYFSK